VRDVETDITTPVSRVLPVGMLFFESGIVNKERQTEVVGPNILGAVDSKYDRKSVSATVGGVHTWKNEINLQGGGR